jgi:hypothetical protein
MKRQILPGKPLTIVIKTIDDYNKKIPSSEVKNFTPPIG